MSKTIIAVDIGTTHIKSVLFDQTAVILKQERCATPLTESGDEIWYCPQRLWEIVRNQMESLLKAGKGKPLGIAITGMAEAGLILDRETQEIKTDIIPWFDSRPAFLAKEKKEDEREVFEQTGLKKSYKYGIYKYLWLLKKHSFDPRKTMWLSACDYIAFCMTGVLTTDPTFAARTYVFDVRKRSWAKERIERFGLREDNFPPIVESGQMIGQYDGIPVAIAGHDHVCAAFAALYQNPEELCDSAGTSETYIGRISVEEKFQEVSGLLYGPFVDGGYFYMANIPSSGHSIEWFRKKMQYCEMSYEEMNQQLKQLKEEPTGILYYPYLTGMGAPWFRSDIRAAIFGIGVEDSGATVLKAILEGIQYQAKWLLDRLQEYHKKVPAHLVCVGGATNNSIMMQVKADILQKQVCVPYIREVTLAGAAALFLLKKEGKELAEVFLQNALMPEKVYDFHAENSKHYQKIFEEQYLPLLKIFEYSGKES